MNRRKLCGLVGPNLWLLLALISCSTEKSGVVSTDELNEVLAFRRAARVELRLSIKMIEDSTVQIMSYDGNEYRPFGSGFIASPDGIVLTARHVLFRKDGLLKDPRLKCLYSSRPKTS